MNKEQEKKFFELICVCNNQQQELERYKNIIDELKKENEILTQARYSLDRVDLEERINKAIEYMNNYNELVVPDANIKSLILKEEYKKIINLLQGKSDE